jgi:hypothetical protein
MTTTKAAILHRETAHLSELERDRIARRLAVAVEIVALFPRATERPLSEKLRSYGDCPRWVCDLVASAAIEAASPSKVAA